MSLTLPRFSSRRQFLAGTMAAASVSVLPGCRRAAGDKPYSGRTLKVFNWSDYIAAELIPEFERQTGARVVYDNYAADSELEARLATGGDAYDVVFPSDRSMPALLRKGLLREIELDRLSNFQHLDERFLKTPFDPENRYTVPYFWGTVAVGIRTDRVTGPVAGFEVLLDERYRGRITVLDDPEHVVAALLAHLGLPLNSVEPQHLARVQELLVTQKPLIQAYTSDGYKERLIGGQAWAAMGWSGDLRQAADESPQVKVVVPQTGTVIWLDSMALPRGAGQIDLAYAFLDFLLDPAVAARNAAAIHFATPNRTALAELPAEIRQDESVYPPEELLARCEWLRDRGPDVARIEAVWRAVRQ